ncbi:hypothetical protein BZZ08_00383 [Streptomyces sp. MH60]|nr:hypothetical protein BZZ08_00383 [Streptomyces sp. MH60]
MVPKVRSTMPLAVGAWGGAGWTLMPRCSQAAVNAAETNTLPRSTTIVSGRTTGRAAAPARRSSSAASRWWGSAGAWSMRRMSGQVGRAGWGTAISASSRAASTALVALGHSTAARMARVATSTAMVSSGRARRPSSKRARTSRRVVSTCTCSPGRSAVAWVKARPSTLAGTCRTGPEGSSLGRASAVTSRYSVAWDGAGTVPGPCRSSRIWLISGNRPLIVPFERPRRRRSASRTAATTRSSARPVGLEARVVRWSSSPHRPCLR